MARLAVSHSAHKRLESTYGAALLRERILKDRAKQFGQTAFQLLKLIQSPIAVKGLQRHSLFVFASVWVLEVSACSVRRALVSQCLIVLNRACVATDAVSSGVLG